MIDDRVSSNTRNVILQQPGSSSSNMAIPELKLLKHHFYFYLDEPFLGFSYANILTYTAVKGEVFL